jgi:biopolymer transport protein ExbD
MAAKLSGGGGDRFNVEQNSDINVTPFVDVMLVLLIIFMVAAPLASVSVEVNLPPAVAKASQSPPKPVYISIKASGQVFIGDNRTTVDEMGQDIAKSLADATLLRSASTSEPTKRPATETFMEVMNTLQDNGFYSVALLSARMRIARGAAWLNNKRPSIATTIRSLLTALAARRVWVASVSRLSWSSAFTDFSSPISRNRSSKR